MCENIYFAMLESFEVTENNATNEDLMCIIQCMQYAEMFL